MESLYNMGSLEHYHKSSEVFKEKSGDRDINKEILNLHLPSVIRAILQTSCGPQFNVLSVGSGDGDIDLEVLQIVQAELQRDRKYRDMKIFNRAVEPNPYQRKLYKKALENLPDSLKGKTTFHLCEKTFEEHHPQEESSQEDLATKFDLVHFNHSLYFLADIEQTLQHCFEKELQENGLIIVVIAGSASLWPGVYNASGRADWICQWGDGESIGDELIKVIGKNGWKYKMFSQESKVDVTEVFDEDSIKGNLLLDFMTVSVNYRVTVDESRIAKLLSLIRDKTVVNDGQRLGKSIDVMFVISK